MRKTLQLPAAMLLTQALAWPLPALAQPQLVLKDAASLRSAPPAGPLNALVGPQVQALPRGALVTVLGRKTYGGFDGSHVWLQVRPAGAPPSAPAAWVYGGRQQGNDVLPSGVQLPPK